MRSAFISIAALASLVGCQGSQPSQSTFQPGGSAAGAAPRAGLGVANMQPDPSAGYGCPLALPNVNATIADVDKGAAVTFAGPASEIATLRSRVHWLAEEHGRWTQGAAGGWYGMPCMSGGGWMMGAEGMMGAQGMMGGQSMMGGQGMMGSPGRGCPGPDCQGGAGRAGLASDAYVLETDSGAKLTLIAKNPSDVSALRSDVRAWVEQMQAGRCPMM